MATVSIDIDAMIDYVASLESAIAASRWASLILQTKCTLAGEWDPDCASFNDGESTVELEALLSDARRRLGLAQLIAAMTPGLGSVVVLDDKFIDQFPADFVFCEPDPDLVDELVVKLTQAGSDAGLTVDQLRAHAEGIAVVVANSPEPYKSLFEDSLGKVNFTQMSQVDLNAKRPAHYDGGFLKNTIYIDFANLDDGPYPYFTFFHEFGHAVDDLSTIFGDSSTKVGLYDLMRSDVQTDLEQTMKTLTGAFKDPTDPGQNQVVDEQASFVISAIINRDFDVLAALDPTGKGLYVDLVTMYGNVVLVGSNNVVASDLYGGITGNIIHGTWFHPSRKDDQGNPRDTNRNGNQDDDYWFPGVPSETLPGWPEWMPIGEGSFGHETEFWAGYYASQMTSPVQIAHMAANAVANPRDYDTDSECETSLTVTQERFPTASKQAAEMAEEMAN